MISKGSAKVWGAGGGSRYVAYSVPSRHEWGLTCHSVLCVSACTELTDRLANRLLAEGKIKTTLADADFEARIADLFRDCTELVGTCPSKTLHSY